MTYTEDALVEQPAIQLFSDLDWETAICWDEVFGSLDNESLTNNPMFFGRETRNDVVLFARLQTALLKLINDKRFIPLIKKKIVDAKAMKKVE